MSSVRWLAVLFVVGFVVPASPAANWLGRWQLQRLQSKLHGCLIDYTHNHGADRRIYSPALCQKRDLYVYLPPGFHPGKCYPLMLHLHALEQDERGFLEVLEMFDAAMACGRLPPFIIAAPDGSTKGRPGIGSRGSFFINSNAGRFEDFLLCDVWGFVTAHYPIRPEREAHILAGASMGGAAAYNLGIKHRDCFAVTVGIFPPLNLRWVNCKQKYRRNFDPRNWSWRDALRPFEVIAWFHGWAPVMMKRLTDPLFGRGPDALGRISEENPAEMLTRWDVRPGELAMFVGYGGKDEFNLDAQIESFLYIARCRGLCVAVAYDPKGKHDLATGRRLLPHAFDWLAPRVAPYAPCP